MRTADASLLGREVYIGDGVYASLDPANMILLRTLEGNKIYLEQGVYDSLVEFAQKVWPEDE